MSRREALELDTCLEALARHYAASRPPSGAVERLLARLAAEQGRAIPDDELDWLAAAGRPFPEPEDPL